ncbi:MAG: peptide chain release factor N(5)-glutamine methyltransferase [Burkholderiaceae bacterium]|jgi:release factor glutamine methyltransferase|nr:peptide chain release factor N(5)-glutamine methyltransferase [Burkholderiaceae bacterium]
MTLAQALVQAESAGLPRLDAQMLLLHLLGCAPHERAWLLTHDSEPLDAALLARWRDLLARRLAGAPVAYLTGRKAFYGLELHVDARVLDPRDDTETLVDWVLTALPKGQVARVLDLGAGSGAVALAIAPERSAARATATDASLGALAVARANGQRLNLPVRWLPGAWHDWFAPFASGQRFDLIVSNPPYVAEDDPHLAALTHEPPTALTSGPDGLRDIRRIVAGAPAHLASGGWLLLEHGYDQAPAVRALFTQAGYAHVQSRRDLAGIERCSGGQWTGAI